MTTFSTICGTIFSTVRIVSMGTWCRVRVRVGVRVRVRVRAGAYRLDGHLLDDLDQLDHLLLDDLGHLLDDLDGHLHLDLAVDDLLHLADDLVRVKVV